MKEQLQDDKHELEVYIGLMGYIRETLCRGNVAMIKKVFEVDLFPLICKFARATEYRDLMIEITWILTNITSSEDKEVINYILQEKFEVISYLSDMIQQEDEKLKEHAIWCFANLMEGNTDRIKRILETPFFDILNSICLSDKVKLGTVRTAAWALSNLMRYTDKTQDFLRDSIEMLSTMIFIADKEVVADATHGFKYLSEIEEKTEELQKFKLETIAEVSVIPKLLELSVLGDITSPGSLRAIGNISSYSNSLCDRQIVKAGWFIKA